MGGYVVSMHRHRRSRAGTLILHALLFNEMKIQKFVFEDKLIRHTHSELHFTFTTSCMNLFEK